MSEHRPQKGEIYLEISLFYADFAPIKHFLSMCGKMSYNSGQGAEKRNELTGGNP